MVGIVERIKQVIRARDTSAVFGQIGEFAIGADGIGSAWVGGKLLLQHVAVLRNNEYGQATMEGE